MMNVFEFVNVDLCSIEFLIYPRMKYRF